MSIPGPRLTGEQTADGAGRERFLADAAARGLTVELVQRRAACSLAEAAGILGIRPADIVKSLVVKHKDGSFLFALVPGDRQISWPKLRQLVGVNKLSLPSAEVALAATGYERGTITPLGSTSAWPVYADSTVTGRRISMGAGEHGYSAFVDADALTAALGAVVADITDPA
ncbi:aminoacyl-tRNA deacylase [Arthrobacter sp. B3I4]|uniref:aminoacyl-tRNA deacylase n=1 Tax=Arthrobacter sp. B3I4 TaxID=3042267 RepID=UPI00278A832D|nr:YbaK/EbsC family protein [Arthrobacter sp. B3I4]MDQ0755467.1 Cys-tRNA(Pro)/Cys-tRNA(Cys) deacylase [Arthrobacter sp. B3I4]